ncbi:MAG: hypothetical protein MK207_05615 [Saprospiraceae bacterium]|nr:hypothetical protein [Saprospiraceae bacterium]
MEVALFVLGLIAALGGFSLYKSGKKKAIISKVIRTFIKDHDFTLMKTEKPFLSGPFHDDLYDEQMENLYQNLGYRAKETLYRKVYLKNKSGVIQEAWLQLRIENLKVTFIEWKLVESEVESSN